MRNILFVCLDSVRYDTFEASNAKNMKAIGPLKRTHSIASCTTPSMIAYLSGYPPIGAGRKDLFRRGDRGRYKWAPKFFAKLGWGTAWLSSNTMMLQFNSNLEGAFSANFKHFKSAKYVEGTLHPSRVAATPEIIKDIRKIMAVERGSVFMSLLIMDTHRPYNFADGYCDIDPSDPEKNFENQVRSIEYFDSLFPDIVNPFRGRGVTDVIITSDHGELFGPIYWSHDSTTEHLIFDEKLHEVPFIAGQVT